MKSKEDSFKMVIDLHLQDVSPHTARQICQAQQTGCWLTVTPLLDYGTALSATEFQDSLHLWFGLIPLHLPKLCSGCPRQIFDVGHGLQCKKGGLICARHEDLCQEWAALSSLALSPSSVSDEPIIPSNLHTTHNRLCGTPR